jgi:hypothetical protein
MRKDPCATSATHVLTNWREKSWCRYFRHGIIVAYLQTTSANVFTLLASLRPKTFGIAEFHHKWKKNKKMKKKKIMFNA